MSRGLRSTIDPIWTCLSASGRSDELKEEAKGRAFLGSVCFVPRYRLRNMEYHKRGCFLFLFFFWSCTRYTGHRPQPRINEPTLTYVLLLCDDQIGIPVKIRSASRFLLKPPVRVRAKKTHVVASCPSCLPSPSPSRVRCPPHDRCDELGNCVVRNNSFNSPMAPDVGLTHRELFPERG